MEGKLSKIFISEVCNTHLYQTTSNKNRLELFSRLFEESPA